MRRNTGYTAVAIALHWVIAAALLINLLLGLWMSWAIDASGAQAGAIAAFQLHKSIGLSVLVLSLCRLAWRLLYPPPALPGGMGAWERAAALVTHWAFYGLMLGIPLSGWLYVSAQWRGDAPLNIPTLWFGLFEVPHLFGLNETTAELRRRFASVAVDVHAVLALSLVLLLVLHVAAALRHQFWRHDGVLARMLPWLPAPEQPAPPRGGLTGAVAAVATLAIAAGGIGYATQATLGPPGTAATAEPEVVLQRIVAAENARGPAWNVVAGDSEIRFSGVHAGNPFQGRFGDWRAAIHFDPRRPQHSLVAAVVDTGSATDGVPLHDRTLPQGEWFDVANHPYATYRSTRLQALGNGRYELAGTLTIKEHLVELAPFTLTVEGDRLRIQGEVTIDRAEVDMGMESDPDGQYVSREIEIAVDVVAQRRH